MAETEIINQVYEETLRQLCTILNQKLMEVDANHEAAERRFKIGLKAAAFARDRMKELLTVERQE